MGAGSTLGPARYSSAAAAAARPSAMAHTISDCPRPMSPATNTPGPPYPVASQTDTAPDNGRGGAVPAHIGGVNVLGALLRRHVRLRRRQLRGDLREVGSSWRTSAASAAVLCALGTGLPASASNSA